MHKVKDITDWNKVVFLDETWLNANHTVSRSWTDDKAESTTKVPEGKGQRLIIAYAGTSSGFVPNYLLAFKSVKTTEYHEEMDFTKFKEWFLTLLNNLSEPHFILMDNAPYHCSSVHRIPYHCISVHRNQPNQLDMTTLLIIVLMEHREIPM